MSVSRFHLRYRCLSKLMKKRLAKKQIKKIVGAMKVNGLPVFNCVSNPEYTGGSCVGLDEDCYKCEIDYCRKYRRPLLLTKRWSKLYSEIHNK